MLKLGGAFMKKIQRSVVWAILAAALYALNSPASKLLLSRVESAMMAALLYLGAGGGTFLLGLFQRKNGKRQEERLTRRELPYTVGMILLDIAAPILLMMGLKRCAAANVSLLNNFEIVATTLLAFLFFKEKISPRLLGAIGLITLASILLSIEDASSFQFSEGSVFVLLACVCWGLENNCTRMMSAKDPMEIVVIKGFGSGTGSLLVAFLTGEQLPELPWIPVVLLLGFVAYGLSIFFYVYAQRSLGAARTSTYYAVSPFIGAALSAIFLREKLSGLFPAALLVMIAGTILVTLDEQGISVRKQLRGLLQRFRRRPEEAPKVL